MRVLGDAAVERLGRPLATCDHVELYSCFPVAVRVQQRELGLPLDGTPTVTGGMSFAGGPFNSYVFQALVAMVRRLRAHGGTGLVTSVSGLLTKPGLGVWASESDGRLPLIADLADEVSALTATETVVVSPSGGATIVTSTVTHEGQDPVELVAIVDLDSESRAVSRSRDARLVDRALRVGVIGDRVDVVDGRIEV